VLNEQFEIEAPDHSVDRHRKKTELRRRWLWLMPVVFFTYSLAYLGSVFFLGYFLFQVPAAA
jgi:hypothetical protein